MIQGPFSFLASFKDYKLHLCHVHHLSVSHGYLLLVVAADTESVTINATLPLPILWCFISEFCFEKILSIKRLYIFRK